MGEEVHLIRYSAFATQCDEKAPAMADADLSNLPGLWHILFTLPGLIFNHV
jgi:hypothetical protein